MAVLLILHADIKEVPWTAGVAVTARECEWQVLHEEAVELVVLTILHRLVEFGMRDRLGQVGEEGMVFVCQSTVEGANVLSKSRTSDLIVVAIEATAHGVEERVGKVACIVGLIRRGLYTIVLRHYLAKVGGSGLQG